MEDQIQQEFSTPTMHIPSSEQVSDSILFVKTSEKSDNVIEEASNIAQSTETSSTDLDEELKLKQDDWQRIISDEVKKGIPWSYSAVHKYQNKWLSDVKKRMVNNETFHSWVAKNQDAFNTEHYTLLSDFSKEEEHFIARNPNSKIPNRLKIPNLHHNPTPIQTLYIG